MFDALIAPELMARKECLLHLIRRSARVGDAHRRPC
jgi:hypothetical protein